MHHYTYFITNIHPVDERKYYIGSRSCKCDPVNDVKYMSSSKDLKEEITKYGIQNFKKEILNVFETRDLALFDEIKLHIDFDVDINPNFYNKAKQTSHGFNGSNRIYCFDKELGYQKTITKDEYHSNKEKYVWILQREGKVSVRNIKTGENLLVSKEEFDKSDDFVGVVIGTVTAKNTKTGELRRIPKDLFDISDEWISPISEKTGENSINAKNIQIYDANDILMFDCYGNFSKICKENKLPQQALYRSYHNFGEKIYQDLDQRSITKLKNKNFYQYKGWYALLDE